MFKIYSTKGSYPNLELDKLLFEHANVTISGAINKTIEDDQIPLETFPDVWDSYTLNKEVTVGGTLIETDSLSVGDQYKLLDKIMLDYAPGTDWTNQPMFDDSEEGDVLAFTFYLPKSVGGDEEIILYGLVSSFSWNYASGAPHINYELKFKSYARRWVL